jgi:hypothetical protein
VVNAFGQRIALHQPQIQVLGERLNDGHFEAKPAVAYFPREGPGIREEIRRALSEAADHRTQRKGSVRLLQRIGLDARRRKCVERNVDAIERKNVLPAILKVIDHLQGGAQRV